MATPAFAEFQPKFAAHNISVFPVGTDGKKPSVKGYDKIGPAYRSKLRERFPDAVALGFVAGPRSGITVLDIDRAGKDGERLLQARMDRHGVTPFVVRTGSGHFHAYYRNDDEPRIIRLDGEPVDLLGNGLVIAPPSRTKHGRYEIIHGGMDDLHRLPKITNVFEALDLPTDSISDRIKKGERNKKLWYACMAEAPNCDSLEDLVDVACTIAESEMDEVLSAREIAKLAASAWSYETAGKNFVGKRSDGAKLFLMNSNQDAFYLHERVSYHNRRRDEFFVANSFAESMGWTRKRLSAARKFLLEHGYIVERRKAATGKLALYGWGYPSKPARQDRQGGGCI